MASNSATVEVRVFDLRANPLPEARVSLAFSEQGGEKLLELEFEPRTGAHATQSVRPGRYRLSAAAKGYQDQEREIDVPGGITSQTVVLGEPGMPIVYRERTPFPFEPHPELIALSAHPSREREQLDSFLRELGVDGERLSEAATAQGFRLLQVPADDSERYAARLRDHRLVQRVGPVVALDEERVIFATEELTVRFQPWVSESDVPEIAGGWGLEVMRSFPYAGNAFLLRAKEPPGYDLLARFAELAGDENVLYAEPNLVSSGVPDQVVPDDQLYADQWHLPHAGLPDAWQELRDSNPPGVNPGDIGDITFGSEEVVIAIMDEGIESRDVAGVTTPHPDFSGDVTSGDPKMFGWIDWVNLVEDNNSPLGSHGTCCAGVAAANADNPAPVAGEEEGVAGAAGNCRLLGMIFPSGRPETDYADAYVWAAGFDPGSSRPGFPAQLPRGADVFSTSYGFFTGAPISGLMKDCFDHIATYGRGGRGAVCFFSAGNANSVFNLMRPWAAYERNFAIAASTDADERAPYSNFGSGIDLCAPSSGGTDAITTTDRVGLGVLAGHTGGSNDYTSGFGGTSSATPFTAGLAALLFSINPTLTCVELRRVLQETAVKIDFANTDPEGEWIDLDGDGVNEYSRWYGYGRIDAHAAVVGAGGFAHDSDLVVRDDLSDGGGVPSSGAFFVSPDLWVRNKTPASDGGMALPAGYPDPPPHQNPDAGLTTNHVYARIRNIGTAPSSEYYVRFYLSHWPGAEFTYPASFIPTTRPSGPIPSPLRPGTYLIGEVRRPPLAGETVDLVSHPWNKALIPPAQVMVGGTLVHWHPCLLLEVSPHDGPAPTGVHVWDDNNLAQRNLSIIYPDSDADLAAGMIVGGDANDGTGIVVEVDRSSVPPWVQLFASFPEHRRWPVGEFRRPLRFGYHGETPVVWLDPRERTRFRVHLREDELALMVVGAGETGGKPVRGRVTVAQLSPEGLPAGGYAIELGGKR